MTPREEIASVLGITVEELDILLPLAKQAVVKERQEKLAYTWYHLEWGPFECIVGPLHARSEQEAIKYALGPYGEWSIIKAYRQVLSQEEGKMPRRYDDVAREMAVFLVRKLNHEEFNAFCKSRLSADESTT